MLSRASRQVFIQNRAAAFQRPGMLAVAPALNQRPAQFEFMQRSFGSDSAFLHRSEVQERVLSILKGIEKVDADKVTPDVAFSEVGLDSLDTVEFVMALEDDFSIEIGDEDAEKILTTKDAIDYISTHPGAK